MAFFHGSPLRPANVSATPKTESGLPVALLTLKKLFNIVVYFDAKIQKSKKNVFLQSERNFKN